LVSVCMVSFAFYGKLKTFTILSQFNTGIGLSSVIASLYTLMENTIEMNASICGILNMMGTMGSVFMPLLIGQHMDHFPMALIYACLACASLCLLLFGLMHLLLVNKNRLIAVPVCEKKKEKIHSKK